MTMETVRAVTRAIDAFRDEAVETLARCETRVDADEGALREETRGGAGDRVAIQGDKVCRCREAGAGGAVLRRW